MITLKDTNKAYLTPNEVAELLMVAPVTVRTWAQKGLLVAKVTPGGHRRFLKSEVERFVRESAATHANVKSCASRVLIVDDDPLMPAYIHDILEDPELGFVTGIAKNSFEAGVKIHTFAPDVVLLNFMRPDIDAFQICSLIKSDAAMRHIRVIAIAVDVSAENVSRILEAGAETFLAKPFNPQDLLGILSHTAGEKKILPGEESGTASEPKPVVDEPDISETLLFSLKRVVETRNRYIGHHDATRLANMADIFGRSLGRLGPEELLALHNACVLHDIGNLGIPDKILLKPAPLTEEEWMLVRSHTLIGAQLCSVMKDMTLTVPIIRSHHERWDGSGYPDGLKGEAIPFLARVFQFVDIFDALISPRPYKPALSFEEVISILRKEIDDGGLDPNLGAVFLELLNTRPQDFNEIRTARDDSEL
ncbi:MAG: HD domain-containing phosphohydrolase [Kiritimatiellales bacterium]|jgi:putative two-component system response regulator